MKPEIKLINLKVIHQRFITSSGVEESYAVYVDSKPRGVFYSKEAFEAFKRTLYGN